jgi:hypothetical protein
VQVSPSFGNAATWGSGSGSFGRVTKKMTTAATANAPTTAAMIHHGNFFTVADSTLKLTLWLWTQSSSGFSSETKRIEN